MTYLLPEPKNDELRARIHELATPREPIPTDAKPKLQSLENIKAVYFDVYGTILISGTEPMVRNQRSRQVKLMHQSLLHFEMDVTEEIAERAVLYLIEEVESVHSQKKKKGIDYPEVDIIAVWASVLEKLNNEHSVSIISNDLIPDLITHFVTVYDEPWIMPHLTETLASISKADKQLGIISNSQFYSPLTLEALKNQPLKEMGFAEENCFWSYAEDIAKPSVRFYEIARKHLLDEHNIQPEQMLFVGNDLLNDILPAQQAGFNTALFAADERSLRLREDHEQAANTIPDLIVTSLLQIPDCI